MGRPRSVYDLFMRIAIQSVCYDTYALLGAHPGINVLRGNRRLRSSGHHQLRG